jgi:hypothetical protein
VAIVPGNGGCVVESIAEADGMKKLFIALLVLGVVALGGYFALVTVLNPEAQRAALEQRLEEVFGRQVTAGPMRLVVLPRFGVEIAGLAVAQEPSFGEGNVIAVDRVWAGLGFWAYALERRPVIERLSLHGTRVTLVKRADGVWNWATLGRVANEPAVATSAEWRRAGGPLVAAAFALQELRIPDVGSLGIDPRRIVLERFEIANAIATVTDHASEPDTEVEYRALSLVATIAPEGEGYRVRGNVQSDSAAAGGEPLASDIPFDSLLSPPTTSRAAWIAQGSLGAGRFATRNVQLDSVTTEFVLDEAQVLRLDNLRVNLYGGTLEGKLAVDLRTPENRFSTYGHMADVSLAPAFAARPDLAGAFDGKLTTEFKAEGQLGNFDQTLGTMSGAGTLALADVQISSVNILSEVAKKGGFDALQFDEPGTHVDRFEAAYRLQQGRLDIDSATLTNINGYANATVRTGWIDLKAPASVDLSGDVTVLPPMFEKVAKVSPIADVVLSVVGSKGSLTVPLGIRGPLQQPAVAVRWEDVLTNFLPFGLTAPSAGFSF